VLREPLRTGRRGRPRLLLPEGLMVAQAVERYARRRVIGVVRRVVCGTQAAVGEWLRATQGGATPAVINTAYVERLQATFRSRLAPLARRTRAAARRRATLEVGMWLIGTTYTTSAARIALSEVGKEAQRRRAAALGRTNSGSSCWAHRSPLVVLRIAELCCSSESTQAARETTEMVVGGYSCGLTTHPRLNGVLPLRTNNSKN